MVTIQKASYKLMPNENASHGTLVPFRISVGDSLSPNWVACISLVSFTCTYPSLAPDSPAFLGEKIIDENHVTIVKGEVVRVGNVLKSFNQGKELALCNPTPFSI